MRTEERVAGAVGLGHTLLDVLDGKSVTFSDSYDGDTDQLGNASESAKPAEGKGGGPIVYHHATTRTQKLTLTYRQTQVRTSTLAHKHTRTLAH